MSEKPVKPLKAFECHDGDEAWEIRFGTSDIAVRREFADEHGMNVSDIGAYGGHVRRKPSLDTFAPGPVPPKALFDMGWWFGCHHCDRRVSDDESYDEEDEHPLEPVFRGHEVYCCQACMDAEDTERADRKRIDAEITAEALKYVTDRYPGITVERTHAYADLTNGARGPRWESRVHFQFPGSKYGASFHDGGEGERTGMYVANGDKDAWEAYVASLEGERKVAA